MRLNVLGTYPPSIESGRKAADDVIAVAVTAAMAFDDLTAAGLLTAGSGARPPYSRRHQLKRLRRRVLRSFVLTPAHNRSIVRPSGGTHGRRAAARAPITVSSSTCSARPDRREPRRAFFDGQREGQPG